MKTTVVIVSAAGARISINPTVIPEGALINPSFHNVEGLPPHQWDIENGRLVPASPEVLVAREKAVPPTVLATESVKTPVLHDTLIEHIAHMKLVVDVSKDLQSASKALVSDLTQMKAEVLRLKAPILNYALAVLLSSGITVLIMELLHK